MADRRSLHRFYCDEPLAYGQRIRLSDNVSEQIRRVLRLKVGDVIVLFDGSGFESIARIESPGPGQVTVEVAEEPIAGRAARGPAIHLAVALLKADRFEMVVQKATELGVSTITPLETQRCVVSLSADRARARVERWRRIAIEALEQSGRADTVEINDPISLDDALATFQADRKLIAWERETASSLTDRLNGSESAITIMIGPEGGFTEHEADLARSSGFAPVSLGDLILRSETAAIAAVSMIRTTIELRTATGANARAD